MAHEPSPAFQFYPKEWFCYALHLSLCERGRLFTEIVQTVADGNRDVVQRWDYPFIGRVYWRRGTPRPWMTQALRRAVFDRDGGQCLSCGSTERLEVDHIVAFSRGGLGTLKNLQLLCKPCNRRKGAN